jgi:hypothetical protein
MADDDDRETNREEYLFGLLRNTMSDTKTRGKIFLALCGIPIAANQVNMMIGAVDQFLYPKSKT